MSILVFDVSKMNQNLKNIKLSTYTEKVRLGKGRLVSTSFFFNLGTYINYYI